VAAHLPLVSQRLIVVTGKGGVGKTAVTAALARVLADAGRRTLAVEVGHGRLGALLGGPALGRDPVRIHPGLSAASIDAAEALADFVLGVLRLKLFARRLLQSTTFQVLAAALPGLPEFLVLHTLAAWLDERRLGRSAWDVVIVDAPASGHSLPLLSAPRTLRPLAPFGPFATTLARLDRLLGDPATTLVCLVTAPEEFAVRETVELHRELARLRLAVAPPIVNAVPPQQRFRRGDEECLRELEATEGAHPHVEAARFERVWSRAAAAQIAALRRALGAPALTLPFLFGGPEAPGGIERLADELRAAIRRAA